MFALSEDRPCVKIAVYQVKVCEVVKIFEFVVNVGGSVVKRQY